MGSDFSSGVANLPPPPCDCIQLQYVMTSEEKEKRDVNSRIKFNLKALKESEGNFVEIPENYEIELADVYKCFEKITIVKNCLKTSENPILLNFIHFIIFILVRICQKSCC